MVLSLLVILLIALIALFYYTQGLFAATVAAVCAAVAALMAFSYHEVVIVNYAALNLGAYGNALALVVIFAVVFIGLRTIIDNFLPGNVRYPVYLDRVGAPIMGVVVGIFGMAIVVLAAQQLPFGPRILWYSPYPAAHEEVLVDRRLAPLYRVPVGDDAMYFSLVGVPRLDTPEAQGERRSLLIPVDEWFLSLVRQLDGDGSMAGRQRLDDVYPDYITAIFGHRLGMQHAATQVAYNVQGRQEVSLEGAYRLQTEGEGAQFPEGVPQVPGDLGGRETGRPVEPQLRPRNGYTLIVVRLSFAPSAADRGGMVRFGPGNARLVAGGRQYFPVATLEGGQVAVEHRPDDFLLAEGGADLVYEVSNASLQEGGQRLVGDAFLEFKRFARVSLANRELSPRIEPSPTALVARKRPVQEWISARLGNRAASDSIEEFRRLREDLGRAAEDVELPEAPAEEPGTESPMDTIRREGEERRGILEGGD